MTAKQRQVPPCVSTNRTCLFVGAVAVATTALTFVPSLSPLVRSAPFIRRHHTPSARMFGPLQGVHIPATQNPTSALIFFHGLGDSGEGWAPAFPLPGLEYMQTILPTAPTMPVSVNGGMQMCSWFDIHGLDEHAMEDRSGVIQILSTVDSIVHELVLSGIPSERIVLGGMSQGGAVVLTAALRSKRKFAGFVVLSSWLPLRNEYPSAMEDINKNSPIFMAHGTADDVVQYKFGHHCHQLLTTFDRKITFTSYAGLAHSSSPQEMDDVTNFLKSIIPPL